MTAAAEPDLFAGPHRNSMPIGVPPEVCRLFERFALEAAGKVERYSADAILHRIRWFAVIERGDREFKCNNNWTPALARWFMATNPTKAGFFETRESPNAG